MRFINIDELWPDAVEAFEKVAETHVAALRAMPPEQRADYIEKHANWSDLKGPLAALSHGKCWYTECRSTGGDRDVDHFRPKGKIRRCPAWPETDEKPEHEGYWWLAFHWKNYRYSCRFSNAPRRSPDADHAGGKWNYFPVREECSRIREECDIEDMDGEEALILDPTDADDVDLLSFDDFGRSKPRSSNKEAWDYKRTSISIDLLNLNHQDFVKQRAILSRRIRRLVIEGARAHRDLQSGDRKAKRSLRNIKAELKGLMHPSADYSRFCEIILKGYREHPWVDEMV